jgi:hypothetical protein
MARPKALTNQQEKFCYYLVFGNPETGNPCSKSEAAKLAGYKDPVYYGSRLCNVDKYPLVVAFKHELERELKEKYSINYDGHVSKMGELRDLAKDNKQFSSAIRFIPSSSDRKRLLHRTKSYTSQKGVSR